MLQTPTSEVKAETLQRSSQAQSTTQQALHPHAFAASSTHSFHGATGGALVHPPRARSSQPLHGLQNVYGNQAVLRILQNPQQILRMPALRPSQSIMLQRQCACGGSSEAEGECAKCKEKREGTLQRSVGNQVAVSATTTAPPIVHYVLSSPGQSLDAGTRAFMEPRFGHDFSHVRVHTDAMAAKSAQAVNALAYTVGRNVVFGAGQYAPGTSEGRGLMAHELAHTLQQGVGTLQPHMLTISTPTAPAEQEAEQVSEAITREQPFLLTLHGTPQIARLEDDAGVPQSNSGLLDAANIPATDAGAADVGSAASPVKQSLDKTTNVTDPRCASRTERPQGALLAELHFDQNSATIRPLENFIIPDFLENMAAISTTINVDGYASNEGTKAYNQQLSCSRALAVKAQLVAHGVEAAAINTFAHGATSEFGEGPKNYFANRRVIISTFGVPEPLERGSYTVKGLGERKQAILKNGGTLLDLAVAMLETENMVAIPSKTYPYGDGKTGDAANFGIFKQNWQMIRIVEPMFQGYQDSQFTKGDVLNTNLSLDIQVLHESQKYYTIDYWFAGHRNGPSGIDKPITRDISNYKNAVYWIRDQLASNQKYLQDDTRFYVVVPAI